MSCDENRGQFWTGRGWPHGEISLRGGKLGENIEAIWVQNNKTLEKLDEVTSARVIFPVNIRVRPKLSIGCSREPSFYVTMNVVEFNGSMYRNLT